MVAGCGCCGWSSSSPALTSTVEAIIPVTTYGSMFAAGRLVLKARAWCVVCGYCFARVVLAACLGIIKYNNNNNNNNNMVFIHSFSSTV